MEQLKNLKRRTNATKSLFRSLHEEEEPEFLAEEGKCRPPFDLYEKRQLTILVKAYHILMPCLVPGIEQEELIESLRISNEKANTMFKA